MPRKIEDILDALQMKINLKGYQYWVTSVEMHLENKKLTKGVLCEEVAKVHNTTASRVERALRVAKIDIEQNIKEYFCIDYKISNSIFLELLTREVERSLQSKISNNLIHY